MSTANSQVVDVLVLVALNVDPISPGLWVQLVSSRDLVPVWVNTSWVFEGPDFSTPVQFPVVSVFIDWSSILHHVGTSVTTIVDSVHPPRSESFTLNWSMNIFTVANTNNEDFTIVGWWHGWGGGWWWGWVWSNRHLSWVLGWYNSWLNSWWTGWVFCWVHSGVLRWWRSWNLGRFLRWW
jgi:hypothetical protein